MAVNINLVLADVEVLASCKGEENGKSKVSANLMGPAEHPEHCILLYSSARYTLAGRPIGPHLPSFLCFLQETMKAAALAKEAELAATLSEKESTLAQLRKTMETDEANARQLLVHVF